MMMMLGVGRSGVYIKDYALGKPMNGKYTYTHTISIYISYIYIIHIDTLKRCLTKLVSKIDDMLSTRI